MRDKLCSCVCIVCASVKLCTMVLKYGYPSRGKAEHRTLREFAYMCACLISGRHRHRVNRDVHQRGEPVNSRNGRPAWTALASPRSGLAVAPHRRMPHRARVSPLARAPWWIPGSRSALDRAERTIVNTLVLYTVFTSRVRFSSTYMGASLHLQRTRANSATPHATSRVRSQSRSL